ncbi:Beta-galactosidase jelly roll domain [Dillenia turbinata]|uniref:Beta-galactosidase n=1 Tax=Dillenia turbinata TaxID=194707 RepID=A0AAN8YYB0_9MAGN
MEGCRVLFVALLCCLLAVSALAHDKTGKKHDNATGIGIPSKPYQVTYDGRSLIVNGKRELFFSGSIHYPRSPPEMWPDLLDKAREGGINLIQTYVFWNIHEPLPGQWNFEGNYDIFKFIRLIQEKGMYVTLRIGPYIEAEWNHGGFPYWLREVPNITFRTDNEPFKYHMKKFAEVIIDKMKEEKLFAPQGGPIVMAQIENEYNNIQLAFKEKGPSYVQWAGNMALGLNAGVPWIMCKQKDAPGPIINTCNGRHCGETFTGPNSPNKPSLWTENWTAQYRVFGDPPSQRSAEDLAFSVALFFAKNGTLTNYYMYHGGTNFGRTSSAFATTRYYDEAPLDEYGLLREPKYGHLRDLHTALKLSKKPLFWGEPKVDVLGRKLEVRYYEKPGTDVCAAFLINSHPKIPATITWRGQSYFLPRRSISILPDCKTVVLNTQTINAQHSLRNFHASHLANNNHQWVMTQETIPTVRSSPIQEKHPLELHTLLKDTTDYGWYTTAIELNPEDLPFRKFAVPILQVASLGHALHAFVNGEYVGSDHGSHVEKSFVFRKPIKLKSGVNHIALLGNLVGLPNSGVYLERRLAGVHDVQIQGLNTGTIDLSINGWGHKVGLDGEKSALFTEEGSQKAKWQKAQPGKAITWYKTHFDAPEGTSPVAVNLSSMAKGMAWVNGHSLGRYWVSYLSPLGKPTQSEYHVPRAFLKEKNNLLVLLEEEGGDPEKIQFLTINRDTICSFIPDHAPPPVSSWRRTKEKFETVVADLKPKARLTCPSDKIIAHVQFADYGDPVGVCGTYLPGKCHAPNAKKVVEQYCLGKNACEVPADAALLTNEKEFCPGVSKTLAIQVRCAHAKKKH